MSTLPLNLMPFVVVPSRTSRQGMMRLLSIFSLRDDLWERRPRRDSSWDSEQPQAKHTTPWLRTPAAEVLKHPQPGAPAFLRMELDRRQIAAAEEGGEADAVIGAPLDNVRIRGVRVEGVDEVELTLPLDARHDRVAPLAHSDPIPAHVGDLQDVPVSILEAPWKPPRTPRDDAEAGGIVLLAVVEDDLGPEA